MSEYSDAFLDRIYRIYRMEINPVHPVNPVQNKYSDKLLDNNNKPMRNRTKYGIGLFKLTKLETLETDDQPQSTQRAQSVPIFSVSSVLSVVFSKIYLPIDDISNFRFHLCS
ncbi:MAG: hypothetical protein FIB07_06185 [Candidatus Methanoperedens sp.]|nr:hypothetical protein [Candidatus Methanoperedens sp.]